MPKEKPKRGEFWRYCNNADSIYHVTRLSGGEVVFISSTYTIKAGVEREFTPDVYWRPLKPLANYPRYIPLDQFLKHFELIEDQEQIYEYLQTYLQNITYKEARAVLKLKALGLSKEDQGLFLLNIADNK